jgi:hypothetical protein
MQIQSILLTVIAIAALYLSGCHTIDTPFPTAEQIATAEYGAPLTIDWQEAVKAWVFKNLEDPSSAQYIFKRPPQKGYIHTFLNTTTFNYVTVVEINSKDSSGRYLGFMPYLFVFKNNHVINVRRPGEFTYDPETGRAEIYLQ